MYRSFFAVVFWNLGFEFGFRWPIRPGDFAHATAALPQVLLPPQTRSLPLRCRLRPGVGLMKFVFCFFSSDVLWVYGEAISFGFWQVDFPKMTTSLLYHPENDSTGSFTSSRLIFFPCHLCFREVQPYSSKLTPAPKILYLDDWATTQMLSTVAQWTFFFHSVDPCCVVQER